MVAQLLGVVNVLQPSRLTLCHSALFTGWFPLPREALRALFPSSSEHTHPTWVVRATRPSRSHPAACLLPTLKVAHWIAAEGLDAGCSIKKYILSFQKDIPILSQVLCIKKAKSMSCKWLYKELVRFIYLLALMLFCISHQKIHVRVVCGLQNGLT